jgi:DNA-directed RNA polymerase subunit RPC12/RpoP
MSDDRTYTCDECGDEYRLAEVIVRDGGDRVVCGDCSTPGDRIV